MTKAMSLLLSILVLFSSISTSVSVILLDPPSVQSNITLGTNSTQSVEPICFTPGNPPHAPPLFIPSARDCRSVAAKINEEDTRRPPRLSSFALRGTLPHGRVDYETPIVITSGTCMAIIGMRGGAGHRIGHAFMYQFAEAAVDVQKFCSEPGRRKLGGGVEVGEWMKIAVLGYAGNDISHVLGNGTFEGNTTDVGIFKAVGTA